MTPMACAEGSVGPGASLAPGPDAGVPLSATYTRFPSGDRWMPRGRLPTGKVATARVVAPSMTVTSPEPSLLT